MHLEGQHRAGANARGRALGEGHDVRAGRGAANEHAEPTRWAVPHILAGRIFRRVVLWLPHKERTRGRRAGGTRGGGRRVRIHWHFRVHQHVVHDFAGARHELDGRHPLVFGEVGGNFEVLIFHRARGRYGEVFWHRHDRVRRADLPAGGIHGLGWCLFHVALLGAGVDPSHQRRLLQIGQAAVVAERAVRSLGVPRRHEARAHRITDVVDIRLGTVVVHERERPESGRSMAGRAILVQDRGHVLGERGGRVLRDQRFAMPHGGDPDERHAGEHDERGQSAPRAPEVVE